jgi:hypothetical protein
MTSILRTAGSNARIFLLNLVNNASRNHVLAENI